MGIVRKAADAVKAKIAYERESYRMGVEELQQIKAENPELFKGGRKKQK